MFVASVSKSRGMRSASRSGRCSQPSTRHFPKPGKSSSPRAIGAPSRSSSSTCCPIARSRTTDGRVPAARRDADERSVAGGDQRPFPASYTERVRKIGVVNNKNKMITDVIAKLLDGPAWLRRMMIEKVIVEGYRFDELMRDDEALEDFIARRRSGLARHLHLPDGSRGRPNGGDR